VTSLGAILTTCNPIYTKEEINHQINATQPKFVVTVEAVRDGVECVTRQYQFVEDVIIIGKSQSGCTNFDDLLQCNGTRVERPNFDSKEQVCLILFSSGTTGLPKGVLLTHYNMVSELSVVIAVEESGMRPGNEVFLNFIPYYHGNGMFLYLLYSLTMGATNIVHPNFDFKRVLGAIQQHKVTFLHLVPPVALRLLMDPIVESFDLSSLHTASCGAAPLGAKQAKDLVEKLKIRTLRQGYGMTELSVIATINPTSNWKHGSVGVVLSNMIAKVVDVETGKVLVHNQSGELCFKGPQVMKGYLNNPKATEETIDKEGWLHTGDIGYFDEDGHVYVIDRLKELIKYNGLQVPPAELESHLLKHPGIADAAVVGVPDLRAGEVPRAYIVIKPGQNISPQDVHEYLKDKVAPYKRLRGGVMFRDSIPKSASGKILRRELKNEILNETKSKL